MGAQPASTVTRRKMAQMKTVWTVTWDISVQGTGNQELLAQRAGMTQPTSIMLAGIYPLVSSVSPAIFALVKQNTSLVQLGSTEMTDKKHPRKTRVKSVSLAFIAPGQMPMYCVQSENMEIAQKLSTQPCIASHANEAFTARAG